MLQSYEKTFVYVNRYVRNLRNRYAISDFPPS